MSRLIVLVLASTFMFPKNLFADQPPGRAESKPFNVEGPTFGGKQLWTDEVVFQGWRIQRNVWSGHYRLLDDKDFRKAWGTAAHCKARLEASKEELQLPPMRGKVVVVLHGLVRSRQSMKGLVKYLHEHGEYSVVNVSYASTREPVGKHAKSLASVIGHLGPKVTEINFVAHSLGNLVIRHYLGDQIAAEDKQPDPRIKRIVMLAPPNNGSQFAIKFGDNKIFKAIWGTSGVELAKDWKILQQKLATPTQEFGIIAGGRGEESGRNPLLLGDDDFVVTLEETRLPGAHDFTVVPVLHSLIMDDAKTREYALRFLWHGYFVDKDQRQPIPIERDD